MIGVLGAVLSLAAGALHGGGAVLWPQLAYVGPDQLLPLGSFLAGLLGILLMLWRQALALAGRAWRSLLRRTGLGS
jgi:hypothetical protein